MSLTPPAQPLAVVEASPAAVLRKDEPGWLELFTEDALIEDPVGAAQYRGRARLSAFWRVFIAPQKEIVFHPRREFVSPQLVVRQVTIATVTPVSPTPVEVEAILEYRLRGSQVASMRAFWNPRAPVIWHLRQGLAGLGGLVRHGARLLGGLGLQPALAFGRALVPTLSSKVARTGVHQLAEAPRTVWLQTVRGARIEAVNLAGNGETTHDPEQAWAGLRGEGRARRPEAITIAGDHVAAILTGEGADVAMIARIERGQLTELLLLGASRGA